MVICLQFDLSLTRDTEQNHIPSGASWVADMKTVITYKIGLCLANERPWETYFIVEYVVSFQLANVFAKNTTSLIATSLSPQ